MLIAFAALRALRLLLALSLAVGVNLQDQLLCPKDIATVA